MRTTVTLDDDVAAKLTMLDTNVLMKWQKGHRHEDRRHRHLLGQDSPRVRVEDVLCGPARYRYDPRADGERGAARVGRELPTLHPCVLGRAHRRGLPHVARAHGAPHRWP